MERVRSVFRKSGRIVTAASTIWVAQQDRDVLYEGEAARERGDLAIGRWVNGMRS